jgi:hypothetical protein
MALRNEVERADAALELDTAVVMAKRKLLGSCRYHTNT